MKFKPGDRVRVIGYSLRVLTFKPHPPGKATVTFMTGGDGVQFKFDDDSDTYFGAIEQLRKLKPKAKPAPNVIWIKTDGDLSLLNWKLEQDATLFDPKTKNLPGEWRKFMEEK